jgi:pyruvate dehydrogenase E2 component (dihydrolipoamide acetyltransferase)
MAETVSMPKLGFDMAEGTLVRWIIQTGEPVQKGAVLAEIETDKATVEVESNFEGILAQQLVQAGAVVPVNAPIAIISAPGETLEQVVSVTLPETMALSKSAEIEPTTTAQREPAPEAIEGRLPGNLKASPLARRMAAEMHVNLDLVQGSGPAGRIVQRDIKAYLSGAAAAATPAPSPTASAPAASAADSSAATSSAAAARPVPAKLAPIPFASSFDATAPSPPDQVIPLARLRFAIGRRMVESKQQAPHFYVTHEYDVESLLSIRTQINSLLPEEEKISVNDFIVKATSLALRQFPNLNAALRGDQVVQFGAIHIGVAVAVENGLLTVVCHDADRKSLHQIAVELRMLAARARQGKVRPEDIEGSTFSISNLGMYEVEHFIAILNPPEAAILALGSARQVPVVKGGQVVPGWRMKATISVDHRVSDGAEAARFLQSLTPYLEEPVRLLL